MVAKVVEHAFSLIIFNEPLPMNNRGVHVRSFKSILPRGAVRAAVARTTAWLEATS
jgi:hypothetical protein